MAHSPNKQLSVQSKCKYIGILPQFISLVLLANVSGIKEKKNFLIHHIHSGPHNFSKSIKRANLKLAYNIYKYMNVCVYIYTCRVSKWTLYNKETQVYYANWKPWG